MAEAKWRRYEELIRKVQADLAPDALVTLNEKVRGRLTGVDRQVDISVRKQVGQFSLFVAVECKDHATPVDVKVVEEFIGLVQDVGANKGALVSASGYTQAALARGRAVCLDMFTLVDTRDHDWRSTATIPVVVHIAILKAYELHLRAAGRLAVPASDLNELEVFGVNHAPLGNLLDVLKRYWDESAVPNTSGTHSNAPIAGEEVYVNADGEYFKVEISASLEVEATTYYRALPLAEVTGFHDHLEGKLITKGFTTTNMNVDDIVATWRKVDNLDDLAIRPVMTIWIRGASRDGTV